MKRHVIGPVSAFPPGIHRVEVGGRAIAIFNVDGERFFGLRDACPHQGAALSSGNLVGALTADRPGEYRFDGSSPCVRCPWHGWEYDLETGRSYYDPERDRVRAYAVSAEAPGGDAEACCTADGPQGTATDAAGRRVGPHVAETFEVAVEGVALVLHA